MGEEVDESSPCSRAEKAGANAWRLARLMNPQTCMMSIDVLLAAIYLRSILGTLQDTTLMQRKEAFFDGFENLDFTMDILGQDLSQTKDGN